MWSPQGSILGPLLLLIFINDSPRDWCLSDRIYSSGLNANDTIYDAQVDVNELKSNLRKSLLELHRWCQRNGMALPIDKTKVMFITTRQKRLHIVENNRIVVLVTTGDNMCCIYIDESLQWNKHYQASCKKLIFGYCLRYATL